MRKREQKQAPGDRTSRDRGGGTSGAGETFTSEMGSRADLSKPMAESAPPQKDLTADREKGDRQISGPGPHDLTRGLP